MTDVLFAYALLVITNILVMVLAVSLFPPEPDDPPSPVTVRQVAMMLGLALTGPVLWLIVTVDVIRARRRRVSGPAG